MKPKLNAAFWEWFGDSKVVDAEGQPLVVYHGTRSKFTEFSEEDHPYRGGLLAFFTTSKKFAEDYASNVGGHTGYVMPVYLKIERPFDFRKDWREAEYFYDATGGIQDRHEINRIKMGLGVPNLELDTDSGPLSLEDFVKAVKAGSWDAIEADEFVEWLHEYGGYSGYDGIITLECEAINYGIFEKTQVKSAVDNDGTWDADDPDITSNPPAAKLEVGTRLYHGTSAPEKFKMVRGPAWFSDNRKTARAYIDFHEWRSGEMAPRVLTYRVVKAPTLLVLSDESELEAFLNSLGLEVDAFPEELRVMSKTGYDGWIMPDLRGHARGAMDIMLLSPKRWLELESIKEE